MNNIELSPETVLQKRTEFYLDCCRILCNNDGVVSYLFHWANVEGFHVEEAIGSPLGLDNPEWPLLGS